MPRKDNDSDLELDLGEVAGDIMVAVTDNQIKDAFLLLLRSYTNETTVAELRKELEQAL